MKRFTRLFVPTYVLSHRIVGLDVFRSVAILSVVLSHTVGYLPAINNPFQTGYFLGFFGVELFFVLSGFLIGSILLKILLQSKGRLSFADMRAFWIRRWFRTLPAYYLVLMAWIGLRLFLDWKSHQPTILGAHTFWYFVFLQNAVTPHPEFFNEAWSLAVEEWFYLLFPIALLMHGRFVRIQSAGRSILLIIIGFIVISNLLRTVVVTVSDPEWNTGVRRMMPLRLDSIGVGIGFAWLRVFQPLIWRKYRVLMAFLGTVLFLWSARYLLDDVLNGDSTQGASFFSKTILFSMFSISFGFWLPLTHSVKKLPQWLSRSAVFISLISYSLYLTHGMVIATCAKLPLGNLGIFVVGWVLSFSVAVVLYNVYEHPMTNLREKFTKRATERVTVE